MVQMVAFNFLIYNWFFFQLEDCIVCSENKAQILFKPCNHLIAYESCAKIMKKCVECRTPIDHQVPFKACCGGKIGNFIEYLPSFSRNLVFCVFCHFDYFLALFDNFCVKIMKNACNVERQSSAFQSMMRTQNR